jgi:hypothetical protein
MEWYHMPPLMENEGSASGRLPSDEVKGHGTVKVCACTEHGH